MPKEILFPEKVKVISTGNCFISSLSMIVRLLAPNYRLNTKATLNAAPNSNDGEIANLFDLLTEAGLCPIRHDLVEISYKKTLLLQLLTAALQGGAVCEISVYGKNWLREVLHEDAGWVPRGELHSVVIYGYYQPKEDKNKGWFYIADSFCGHEVFVDWDSFFDTVCLYENDVIKVNIFNLSQDPANLIERFDAKPDHLNDRTRKLILDRLPGKSKRAKLNKVIRPKK